MLAATNRPQSLDEALTRPGRFDRVITVPFPSVAGRIDILKVHARGKRVAANVNWRRIARATSGFSGADLMNLMNTSAIEAVRQVRRDALHTHWCCTQCNGANSRTPAGALSLSCCSVRVCDGVPAAQRHMAITEDDIFAALERLQNDKATGTEQGGTATDDGVLSPLVKRTLATYLAAKALIGVITPGYDELQKVALSSRSDVTGTVYFIPQDAHLETDITTRAFMESHISVRARPALRLAPWLQAHCGGRHAER